MGPHSRVSLQPATPRRLAHSSAGLRSKDRVRIRRFQAIFAVASTVALIYNAYTNVQVQAEAPQEQELIIEKSKKMKGASKEENSDLIS